MNLNIIGLGKLSRSVLDVQVAVIDLLDQEADDDAQP